MRIKLLVYCLLFFIPSMTWALEVSNMPDYVIDGIQRDANQHVIGKTICNTVTRECVYYAFDEVGNLLMRCSGKTKNVFKYSSAGLLRKEINYVYPDGVNGYPEEEQYIESQVNHWFFMTIAQVNYQTLPKAYQELNYEEQQKWNQNGPFKSAVDMLITDVIIVEALIELNGYLNSDHKSSKYIPSTIETSYFGASKSIVSIVVITLLLLLIIIIWRKTKPKS